MDRDREVSHFRDRLLMLREGSNPQKPFNIKRKAVLTKQTSKGGGGGSKLSMQDFVRMDPGYTPDIEHLVFPMRKRNPQQVAPISPSSAAPGQPQKTRSRLAEMFALSRHLQQKSADRETKTRKQTVNRSVDSAVDASSGGTRPPEPGRRWVSTTAEPVLRSNSARISPSADTDMATARGPNVSVLHLRSTSEPWETSPTTQFPPATGPTINRYFPNRSLSMQQPTNPPLTKHQSLGGTSNYKWSTSADFHASSTDFNSPDIYNSGGACNRELSPVRWCDREVDGVYLGRSGWVQVQQRSLDDHRDRRLQYKPSASSSLQPSRRVAIKLADYNCEPSNRMETKSIEQRPDYLSLQSKSFDRKTPSPESYSPPSLTPIISPPPAFQDRNKTSPKPKTFFGKTPFLPRSNAVEDSDASPPTSPVPIKWKSLAPNLPNLPQPVPRKISQVDPVHKPPSAKIPQAKSLEDTTSRRSKFVQRSSSSSSSSVGFRSLDSPLNRNIMPRLSENTDSSIDVYEDADDEDNNSSSLNISVVPTTFPSSNSSTLTKNREKERASPSSRSNRVSHRTQSRRSPAGSDSNKQISCTSPSSSSSESNEYLSRSPPAPALPVRRSAPSRQHFKPPQQEDISVQRVRRSRSLQLPEKKTQHNYRESPVAPRVSPQHLEAHKVVVKIGNTPERPKRLVSQQPQSLEGDVLDKEMLREAEVVAGYLYGSRSRAAAQALLMHRYNNNSITKEDKNIYSKEEKSRESTNNGLTIYYVGNTTSNSKKKRQKLLVRGSTTPNLQTKKDTLVDPCSSDTCEFWPHCANRDSLNKEAQFVMRSSQSYPTHQRSLDSIKTNRSISTGLERKQEQSKRRNVQEGDKRNLVIRGKSLQGDLSERKNETRERRISPNKMTGKRDSVDSSVYEKKTTAKTRNLVVGNGSGSSSGSSDFYLTPNDRKYLKISSASPVDDAIMVKGEKAREMILTRPGSAPAEDRNAGLLEAQQRSMSLPKSFLSVSTCQLSGQVPWRRRGTESLGSSPGCQRRVVTPEASHTAPVTPLHDGGNRRRSPLSGAVRRAKATSTPQLLESQTDENSKWSEEVSKIVDNNDADFGSRRTLNSNTSESVLQKFRKTFSLRSFQKSKDSCEAEVGDCLSEGLGDPSDDEQHVPTASPQHDQKKDEQKYRFGSLIWRSSKERKKLNKAARSAKCNSGDSGIQIEMVPSCGGAAGDSSESHDTDPAGDEPDSPPSVRRRPPHGKLSRPQSDLLNQILIDKFKSDLKQRAHNHQQVRRTRSDLGGQRLLNWDARSSYRKLMSSPAHLRGRLESPSKKPPVTSDGVQLRTGRRYGQLRRSLSQPLDIDKLSPLMRNKPIGLRNGGGPTVLSEDEHENRLTISDEEMMSDSESFIASLSERKKSLELAMDEEMVILAEAVFDHVAIESEELAFRAGDVIEVLETANRDWWWGSSKGKMGWFPAQFVRLRVSQEDTVEDCLAAMASGRAAPSSIRRRTSISLLSNDQVRTSVVRELVNTEREFVKVLQDVSEGYISECRKRKDMFTSEQIETIFINLEEILKFQSSFLKDLEACIVFDAPYKSCLGSCFLKHRSGFKMYSDYCNSHPMATANLQELYQYNNYSKFFEACRLMRGLIEIPLDGYLLTPVQRICKYPLQLAELLKYTKADHKDFEDTKEALDVMRGVAMLINERKRKMESLEKLAAWQQRVEGWEGEDLIEVSSRLIYQGEVVKVTSGIWTNNITLFLFDHQIVYCKKDILKRNNFVYKGRVCLDTCEIIDVPDGKDAHLGVTVRHAIKLYSCVRDKWLVFCCRSSNDKQRWLKWFAEERKLVALDKDSGLELPPSARQLAKVAARCQRRPPRKPRGGKNFKHDSGYMGSTLQLNSNSNSLGRKVGTWFTFGANKKTRHQHRDVS